MKKKLTFEFFDFRIFIISFIYHILQLKWTMAFPSSGHNIASVYSFNEN